jgi:hypothetical protein
MLLKETGTGLGLRPGASLPLAPASGACLWRLPLAPASDACLLRLHGTPLSL